MSTTAPKHMGLWGGGRGTCVVGLARWLCWYYHHISPRWCEHRCERRCELTRYGPQPVSGVCLGTIQTTWDQVETLWTVVFTASHIIYVGTVVRLSNQWSWEREGG